VVESDEKGPEMKEWEEKSYIVDQQLSFKIFSPLVFGRSIDFRDNAVARE